jgi:high-affinity K+ transport system ATPase subunit B
MTTGTFSTFKVLAISQVMGSIFWANCPLPKKVGRFLFVVETAELLNIFLIVLMALFLNAQGRAQFPVQILCLLMNRRAFQTFDIGCAGEKGLQDLSSGFHRLALYGVAVPHAL